MANGMFNSFLVLIGFCMLGLPIILISVTTAPPSIDEYNSSIIYNTIGDVQYNSTLIQEIENINGSSPYYWNDISGLPQLSYLNNISQLIANENEFLANVSTQDYYGLSDLVHVFEYEMTIRTAPLTADGAKENCNNVFGVSNGSFLTWMWTTNDWNASHVSQPNYPTPSINDTLVQIYSLETIEYEITIDFFANIDVGGVQKTISFSRLIYINDLSQMVFFLSNETDWTIVS